MLIDNKKTATTTGLISDVHAYRILLQTKLYNDIQ